MARAGLGDVLVGTITETTEFRTGNDLWEWIIWSNPLPEALLAGLTLTGDERATVQQTLDQLVRERAAGAGPARLSNPVNIGVGTR